MVEDKVFLERTTFDETDLDPATNWRQAWQNQALESQVEGYVELDAALISAATSLARSDGLTLAPTDIDQAIRFYPVSQRNCYEIQSISHFLGSTKKLTNSVLRLHKTQCQPSLKYAYSHDTRTSEALLRIQG